MKDTEGGGIALAITLMAIVGVAAFTIVAVRVGEGFAIPVGVVGFIAAAVVLRGPLGKALARRLEGVTEVAETGPLLEQMDEMRGRLAELEERLDFTERVLTQQREPGKIES